jgi:hypothetical protein
MGDTKFDTELRSISPASVFAIFFSACFVVSLVYCLAVNMGMFPRFSPDMFQQLREKIEMLQPLPRSLAWAGVSGVAAGICGLFLALVYNVFASLCGGVKAEIKE